MSHAAAKSKAAPGFLGMLSKLHEIKLGGAKATQVKVPRKQLAGIIANLTTLVSNGLSLPKALSTMTRERSLQKYAGMLDDLRRRMEAGEQFSSALSNYPGTFTELMVHQVRVGERSGSVPEALERISHQLEKANKIRATVIKRLSYPGIVLTAGVVVITFMISFIIPVFEETYSKAHIPLPFVTRFLIAISHLALGYGWIFIAAAVILAVTWKKLRKNPLTAAKIDHVLLRMPFIGEFLRDMAVLQFIEVLGTMMESGFKVVDALAVAADSIGNRAVRKAVTELRTAVTRGEKLSREIDKHGDLFPPIVSQLVIIGEQTGKLSDTTQHVRQHLEKQIERKIDMMVGTIEPVLTVTLACCIGVVLLAIYLPMFDMISTMGNG